jgi:TRAP-type C4-dicarboxylate transport system permease small subunit
MKKIVIGMLVFFAPFALAAGPTIEGFIEKAQGIMNLIIPLLMTVALAVFFWGIIRYIAAAGNEEEIKKAKGYIIYGLIGIFVLIAWWGIIQIVLKTFFGDSSGAPKMPTMTDV